MNANNERHENLEMGKVNKKNKSKKKPLPAAGTFSVKEAQAVLGLGLTTIYELCESERLLTIAHGKRIRILKFSLAKLVREKMSGTERQKTEYLKSFGL